MSRVREVDPVLDSIKKTVTQFGLRTDGPIGQQILLLGETFYGYRFTSKEFTAVWSASDQTLNVFDQNGKRLGMSILSTIGEKLLDSQGTLQFSPDSYRTRRAA